METWTDLCRCCLSANSKVSLLDSEKNITRKFLEITNIEVKVDDGLPQKLCEECYTAMNSAYQFRKQCIKMDTELKVQLNNLLSQCNESNIESLEYAAGSANVNNDVEFANNPMKQLEAVIKKEPMESDDDYYYVLVIDNPKDKENSDEPIKIKTENPDSPDIQFEEQENTMESNSLQIQDITETQEPVEHHDNPETIVPHLNHDYEENMDSFLISNNIPMNVPATILENEECHDDQMDDDAMNIDETQDSTSQEQTLNLERDEISQDKIVQKITNQNLIKILTTASSDGTIYLNSDGMVQYLTHGGQLDMNDEDEEQSQEVILCEGDESQFQIVKYDGSELVIEYADDSGLATVLQQTEDNMYQCECGDKFEDLDEYEKHQQKHNPAGDYLCSLCGKGFESEEILAGHTLLHNEASTLLECPLCKQLMKRNALTQHIKYGHSTVKPKCTICDKTFANPNNLKRHMMIHTGIKEYECDICNKRFHQKITMQTHRLTHLNPLSCSKCDVGFKDKESYDKHTETDCVSKTSKEELMQSVKQEVTTHLGRLLGYACSLCKRMFSMESALERHIETMHIDPAELLCSECGQVLATKKEMEAHILTHDKGRGKVTTAKRFECFTCGKNCSSHAMLIMHERVHTNERPYDCQLCPLKFKTKTHLRTHQLTHTREKKFGCSVCMKFFALKGNLVVHLRTHTGERPYICSLCGEAFIDSKYLKKHKVKKHAIDNVPWNQYIQIKNDNHFVEDEN